MAARGSDKRLLLVDSDDERRERTAAWLEDEATGIGVRLASGVQEACRVLQSRDVDCVVSDHDLDDGDGLQLLTAVRREHGDLPFVLFPTDGSELLASRAVKQGVTEYVPQLPDNRRLERLVNCVERAVDAYHSSDPGGDASTTAPALFDALTDPAFLLDMDGEFLAVNEAACDRLGYTEAELLSMGPEDVSVPEYSRRNPEHIAQLEREETLRFDAVLERADGTELPVEVNARWLEYYGESAILATARDIAERRARERELRGFREAVENAGHAIYITDYEGTIEYVNEAFEATTGYSAEEAIGRNPRILKSGVHDDAYYEDLWTTILEGEVWQGEVVNERADGERFVVEQTIAPVTDEDGEIERFVAINTEITDRKERERELQRTNERLEEFASVVSHDLRNPLGVARGRVDLAMEECDSDHLRDLRDALERMDDIVGDVLALAREGADDVDAERVDIEAVARDCWRNVETTDADLVVEDLPMVAADPSRLQQLLENLYRNAVEHGTTGSKQEAGDAVHSGTSSSAHAGDAVSSGSTLHGAEQSPDEADQVTIRVGSLDGGDRDGSGDTAAGTSGFFVADDGPGIPPGERDAVFEHGYSTDDDGTGFGLSIVQAIAEAHGWQVDVEESEAGGARLVFRGVTVAGE